MSSDWLMAEGWRQGLFSHCIGENARQPLPFNVPEKEAACYPARNESKITVHTRIYNIHNVHIDSIYVLICSYLRIVLVNYYELHMY